MAMKINSGVGKMEEKEMNKMNSTTNSSVVFRATFMMMAAAVCDQLQKAGIPANLCDINDIYCVCVPDGYARDSRRLLTPEPRRGEILFAFNRNQA
jgi:hypothetical protein